MTGLADRLPAFGECLKAHIQKEEQVLFERMQQEMDSDVLDAVGAALRAVDASDTNGAPCHM